MDYKNHRLNAYPELNIHDCRITSIEYKNEELSFVFQRGIKIDGENYTNGSAMIVAKDFALYDVNFYYSKEVRLKKGKLPFYITKYLSFEALRSCLKKFQIEVYEEIYFEGKTYG